MSTSSSVDVSLSPKAFYKIMLHASKYPSQLLFGALIGTADQSSSRVEIKDAVPISHTIPSVPITEAAFVQIESFFTSSQPQPLQIVGCYGASNNAAIDDPTPFAQKILSKIAAQIPSAVLLQLCTKKFEELAMTVGTSSSSSTIELFNVIKNITPSERKTHLAGTLSAPSDACVKELASLLAANAEALIVDFDAHLDAPAHNGEDKNNTSSSRSSSSGDGGKQTISTADWLTNHDVEALLAARTKKQS